MNIILIIIIIIHIVNNFFIFIFIATQTKEKYLTYENKRIKLQILDTNGSDYYRRWLISHYKNAHGIIFIYDVSNKNTFSNMYKWINHVKDFGNEESNVCKILVGNKIDSYNEVKNEEGKILAEKYNMPFFEMSIKDNRNVEQIFNFITNKILRYEMNKID